MNFYLIKKMRSAGESVSEEARDSLHPGRLVAVDLMGERPVRAMSWETTTKQIRDKIMGENYSCLKAYCKQNLFCVAVSVEKELI